MIMLADGTRLIQFDSAMWAMRPRHDVMVGNEILVSGLWSNAERDRVRTIVTDVQREDYSPKYPRVRITTEVYGRGMWTLGGEIAVRFTLSETDTGTWLDGSQGWTNTYRVIYRAMDWGYEPTHADTIAIDCYRADGAYVTDAERCAEWSEDDPCYCADHVMELSDQATAYLDTLAPDGYGFIWDAGELSLMAVCEHDNCEYGACSETDD